MRRSNSFYLPQLDGLRFFAFLAVFVWHDVAAWVLAFISTPGHSTAARVGVRAFSMGAGGVDLFFTLSAYLITELLMRERRATGTIAIQSFYIRRALRIWPLYFGALLAVSALSMLVPSLAEWHRYLPWFCFFAGNFALCRWGAPVLLFGPLWSISVEEQFYVLWPLALRNLSPRGITIAAAGVWMAGIVFRHLMHGAPLDAITFNTLSRLDPIAAGVLIAASLDGKTSFTFGPRPRNLFILGVAFWVFGFLDGFGPMAETLIALGDVAFLLAAIKAGPQSFLAARPLVYLGRISYGLYVFHGAIITAGGALLAGTAVPSWCASLLELAATISVAALSYRWFETPFLRLKSRFQRVASGAAPDESAVSGRAMRVLDSYAVAASSAGHDKRSHHS